MDLHFMMYERTVTGVPALGPSVIKVFVSVASTLIEPSTAGSATTALAGFLEQTAFGAFDTSSYCGGRRGET